MSITKPNDIPADRLSELSPLQKAALAIKELRIRLDTAENARIEAIAILGMACRFPCANGLDQYWQLLANQQDAISEVPSERWDLERFFDPNPNAPGKINTRYGGFIDGVDGFDAAFFGISPAEAERMDPQQRLLLEVAWHALEDAGLAPSSLRGSQTGVFVGITQMDYGVMQLGGAVEDIQAYTGIGNGMCFIAGRLAYFLGLHGPTFALDTACSSSMVAVHQACQALRNRECDLAIVAGVQLNLTPPMQIFLSKTQSFAPDGRCRTFDEAANGFVLGEGIGVIVLSRLSDTQSKKLPIRALIRASGVNHDGPASGLTVPNEFAQETLLRKVYQQARISPDEVDYIEAHGTATQLGDPIEIGALKSVFGKRTREQPLLLGTVKTNFGHLNASAGIAGLIKVVLMLEHEQVAPNLHFRQPSSRIAWEGFRVQVPTTCIPWPQRESPRIAGVSSFGLSGTNTHTVLQEAPVKRHHNENDRTERTCHLLTLDSDRTERTCHLLTLSARSELALRQLAHTYLDCPAMALSVNVADLCFSANTGRNHFAYRLACQGATMQELRQQLETFLFPVENQADRLEAVPKGGIKRIAMVFTATFPVSQIYALAETGSEIWARCQAAYRACGGSWDMAADTPATVLAAQIVLAELWRAWGVRPDALVGIGVGQLSALCQAQALSIEQAYQALAGQLVDVGTPEIVLYHGTDGTRWLDTSLRGYRFVAGVEDISPQAMRVLMDTGYVNLIGIGDWATSSRDIEFIGTLGQNQEFWPAVLSGLATLYRRGLNVDWVGFDAGYARQRVRLPGYPFQHQRYWINPEKVSTQIEAKPVQIPESLSQTPAVQEILPTTMLSPTATGEQLLHPFAPNKSGQAWAQLLGSQLDAASVAINEVVAQQLAFLRTRGMALTKAMEPGVPANPISESTPVSILVEPEPTSAVPETPTATGSLEVTPDRDSTSITLGEWQLMRFAALDEAHLDRLGEALVAEHTRLGTAEIPIISSGFCRAMLVYHGNEDAAQALGSTWGQRDKRRVLTATARPGRPVVFMFPGVGDHYLRMAHGLYQSEPVFRARMDHCCEILRDIARVDLREILYPPATEPAKAVSTEKKLDFRAMLGRASVPTNPDETRLNQTVHSQPLVFIIEYALGELWFSRGLVPQAMIGYSIGEYAAACLAGVIDVASALRLILYRAQFIQKLPHGVMLAVPLPESRVRPMLNADLSLAIVSTPNQCVVGGPEAAIAAFEVKLRTDEVVSRRLPGTHAFHTHMLASLHEPLIELISGFQLQAPRLPYLSNLTGTWIRAAEACDPSYWARHTWQTVRFAEALERLLDREGRIFLEVGPGQSLGSFVLQHPAAARLRDKLVLPSLRNRYEQQADEAFFLTTLGKLWLSGVELC